MGKVEPRNVQHHLLHVPKATLSVKTPRTPAYIYLVPLLARSLRSAKRYIDIVDRNRVGVQFQGFRL